MSTALQSGDVIRGSAITDIAGQTANTGWFYAVTAVGGSPATDQDFCNALDTAVAALFKAWLPSEVRYSGIIAGIVARSPNPVGVQQTTNAGVGTAAVEPLPKQCAGITSWYTATAGRRFRGRTYWPFPSSAWNDVNGELSGAGKTAADNIASAVQGLTSISSGGRTATIALGIYHRLTKLTTPVTVRLTRGTIATQRRRGDFGRLNSSPI
jgi:hypothetical protein